MKWYDTNSYTNMLELRLVIFVLLCEYVRIEIYLMF